MDCQVATRSQKPSAKTAARQNEALVALHKIGLDLGAELQMDKLLRQIIDHSTELLGADGGGEICLYNPARDVLEMVAATGPNSRFIGYTIKPGEGVVGQVYSSGQPMSLQDYSNWEHRIPAFVIGPHEAVLVAPLRWRDQVIGTLGLISLREGRSFDDNDLWLAELFAAQAAVAIGNARLYEAERKAHLRIEAILEATRALSSSHDLAEVLERILESCRSVLPYTTASIMTLEGGAPAVAALTGFEGQENLIIERTKSDLKASRIIQQMTKDLQPRIIDDVRQHPDWIVLPKGGHIRGWMGLPLVSRRELIGVLMLDSDQVGAYQQEHLEIGQLLAAQATVALENTHLFTAMEGALTQIEAYFRASEAIIAASDPETLLRTIAGPALDSGPCRAYLLYTEERGMGNPQWVEIVAYIENPPGGRDIVGQRFRVQEFPITRLMLSRPRGTLTIPDIDASHSLIDQHTRDFLSLRGLRALTAIPLSVGSRWIGLAAIGWAEPHRVNQEEQFYSVIAPQLAAVIDNRRLLLEAQQAQERFQDMALSTSDWLWETDAQGRILYCSERVVELTGYSVDELIGKTLFDFMTPRDARPFRVMLARLAARKEPIVDLEQWVPRKDGRLLCQAISGVPILDKDGKLLGYRGVSKDITEQRRAEQRDRLAFELGQTLTAVLSQDEICRTIVIRMMDTFGFYYVSIWLYDEDTQQLITRREFGATALKAEKTYAYKLTDQPSLIARAGRTRQVVIANDALNDPYFNPVPETPDARSEAALPLVHGGRLLGVLGVKATEPGYFNPLEVQMLQNLAAQATIALANARLYQQLERQAVQLEKLVRERTSEVLRERERLESIVEHAGEGIFFTRADGVVEYVNPAWQEITGFVTNAVVGKQLAQIVGDEVAQGLNQMLAHFRPGDSWGGEMHARRPDGSEYDASLRIVPVPDPKGRIGNLVGVMHDITARKQIDRMRSKFVANVSHELRTPITNLKLYHTLIASAPGERLAEYINTMGEQVGRLERLVEELLDVSRLDRGTLEIQPELTDLNQILHDSAESQRLRVAQRGLVLSMALLPNLPPAYVDLKRMTQVVTNLLANAINYTPQGGKIGVRSWLEKIDSTEWVGYSVWDNGCGILPEDLPFIFEPFFRSESAKQSGTPGTGLGLSIVKEIVELHQGKIGVESSPEKGTTVTVLLPAYAAPGK